MNCTHIRIRNSKATEYFSDMITKRTASAYLVVMKNKNKLFWTVYFAAILSMKIYTGQVCVFTYMCVVGTCMQYNLIVRFDASCDIFRIPKGVSSVVFK